MESEALNGHAFILDINDCVVSRFNICGVTKMSDYNWCHGPKCHTHKTQDRIRGVKGSKVLRTRKIPQNNWNVNTVWSHFCSQGCYTDFMHKHWEEQIRLHPRTECLETPIEIETFTRTDYFGNPYKTKEIKEVDNNPNP